MDNIQLLAWLTRFARDIGPILVAVNAAWSIYSKIRSLFARKSARRD